MEEKKAQDDVSSFELLKRNLSNKLYGRSEEQARIVDAYRRSLHDAVELSTAEDDQRRSNLVLITGEIGVGATSLAESLQSIVKNDGGFFVKGKFDSLQRREPYAAFVQAFTDFTSQVVAEGDESIQKMRESIDQTIEAESKILVDMIPALQKIIGETSSSVNAHGSDAILRFLHVFRKFVKAVASPDRPLVILLDDLQWSDPCSLDLLVSLAPEVQVHGVLFIATCDLAHRESPDILKLVRRLNAVGTDIIEITVEPLTVETLEDIVTENFALRRDLAQLLYERAQGNTLSTIECLRIMCEEDVLVYKHGRWVFDEAAAQVTIEADTLDSLVAELITRLPPRVQEVLKVAACLGSTINETLLQYALGVPVTDYLEIAARDGLLLYSEKHDTFSFAHDEIMATAYSLIPNEMKPKFHVAIGRKILRRLVPGEIEKYIFVVLDQFRRSVAELEDQSEKNNIALLCLDAGAKSVRASTFRTAAFYFDFGIRLLAEDHWQREYHLSLALYNAAAEVEYCTGELDRVDSLVNSVFHNAVCFEDKLQAYSTKIYALGTANKPAEAITTGLFVLEHLGHPLPKWHWKITVIAEFLRTRRLLRRKSNEIILRLPIVEDQNVLGALQVLNNIFLYCFLHRPDLAPLVGLRMVQLTVKNGLSALAAVGFSVYGMILTSLGYTDEGYRFGQLALGLLDRFQAKVWLPRVYGAVYGCIHEWSKPFGGVFGPLKHAYHVGLETGDVEFAFLNGTLFCFHCFEAGKPLPFIESELHSLLNAMKSYKQEARQLMIASFLHKVQVLRGRLDKRLSFTGAAVDLQTALQSRFESGSSSERYWSHFNELQLAYIFTEYERAVSHGDRCRDTSQVSTAGLESTSVLFFDGLSLLALYQESKRQRVRTLWHVRHHVRFLKKIAKKSPQNVLCLLYLLEAELASIIRHDRSMANWKYTSAIAMATETGHIFGHALACERAGRHAVRVGDQATAESYLRKALSSYNTWGSTPKVQQLRDEFNFL